MLSKRQKVEKTKDTELIFNSVPCYKGEKMKKQCDTFLATALAMCF